MMSLSAREQHVLDGIADGLAGSDPRLTSRLAMFARLTTGEEMPAREMTGRAPADAGRLRPRLCSPRAAPLVWLVIVIALIAVAMAARSGGQACTRTLRPACAGQMSTHYSLSARHSANLYRDTI